VLTARAFTTKSLTPAHFRDGFLTIQRLKGSLRTVQPLVEHSDERRDVNALLASHLTRYGPGGRSIRLFPLSRVQFYRLMTVYGALAGLPRHLCHPHVLKQLDCDADHQNRRHGNRPAIPGPQVNLEHRRISEVERRRGEPSDRGRDAANAWALAETLTP
jgi:hypothetical protein